LGRNSCTNALKPFISSNYFVHRGWPVQKITHPGAADESALENKPTR
jgi:hypothetical protein